MNLRRELALSWILIAASITGCEQKPQKSGMLRSSYLWAQFSIGDTEDGRARADVHLSLEKEDGDVVYLSDGERVECNGSTLSANNSGLIYGNLSVDPRGIYDFVFVRTDETIPVRVEMPAAPEIIGVIPDNRIVHTADNPTVYWDATRPQLEVKLSLSGQCIYSPSDLKVPDNGEAEFPPVGMGHEDCKLQMGVTRAKVGPVGQPFRGGKTTATIQRSIELSYLIPPPTQNIPEPWGAEGGAAGPSGTAGAGGFVGGGDPTAPGLSVFAGIPSGEGSADGIGAAARFHIPNGVAVDGAGNVFVADTRNSTIRKITPEGTVTTLAGTPGLAGRADGAGLNARFSGPKGVAVNGAGNVFVADTGNHTIRMVAPDGVVTTLAGKAGSSGYADGTGPEARFNGPGGVAVDGAGNVFVADTQNNTIRKIAPDGVVTTVAGKAGRFGGMAGIGAAARFSSPAGVAVDGVGTIFVADEGNDVIRKIAPDGTVTTIAGAAGWSGSANGTGAAARFSSPEGVAVDRVGNVYVADAWNHRIRKITADGVVTTLAGSSATGNADGTRAAARFHYPAGVAVDGAGNLFVADSRNNTIRTISVAGTVATLAGIGGLAGSEDGTGSASRFHGPTSVAVDRMGYVFVADTENDAIRKIGPGGVVTTLVGRTTDPNRVTTGLEDPQGLAFDEENNLFAVDGSNRTIHKITPSGVVTKLPIGLANLTQPRGVAVDKEGNLFVADAGANIIRKVTLAGEVTTFAGSGGSGSGDGTRAAAQFSGPSGVAFDKAGNLFVADTDNDTIRKITPAGVVTTLAGSPDRTGSADGIGAAALFRHPQGVAVDGGGNVFVADTGNNAIRKITTAGVVSTVVGSSTATPVGNFPGPLPASLVQPLGVAVDSTSGNLYITVTDAVLIAVFPN